MKLPKISIFAAVLIITAVANGFSLFATVSSWNAVLYSSTNNNQLNGVKLVPGMVVNIEKEEDSFYRVRVNKNRGWVKKNAVLIYKNLFSNVKSKSFLSKNIIEENSKYYLFYYRDGRITKYNLTDRQEDSSQKVKDPATIYPSTRPDIFLMEGVTTNNQTEHHFQIFNYTSGKTAYIGSFQDSRFNLKTVLFSPGSEYAAVLYYFSGRPIVSVYRTDNGELKGYAKNVYNISWHNRELVMQNTDWIWSADFSGLDTNDISYSKERQIIQFPRGLISREFVENKVIGDFLYIQTKNGVYSLDFKKPVLQPTSYRSLNWNDDRQLNFYFNKDASVVRNVKTGMTLTDFQGSEPRTEFIRFVNKGILGRSKIEKIETMILYDLDGKENYRYRAIDDPQALSDNGITAEILNDKDLEILTVENPFKKEFYFVFSHINTNE